MKWPVVLSTMTAPSRAPAGSLRPRCAEVDRRAPAPWDRSSLRDPSARRAAPGEGVGDPQIAGAVVAENGAAAVFPSERTREALDAEATTIVKGAPKRVTTTRTEGHNDLDMIAGRLIERETRSRPDIDQLLQRSPSLPLAAVGHG